MAQNIYDDPEFFAGYSQLPRQVLGLEGAPEWPALQRLLPDLNGMCVVDLGCGFGWASRWMRSNGAASVLGIDLSQNMIGRAEADTDDAAIQYHVSDLATLELPHAAFDLAFSSLAFHYVEDFGRLVRTLVTALKPGGTLIFSIEHPIYMAATAPRWLIDAGQKTWPVNGYFNEGERRTDWLAPHVLKYHRTLDTTLNTLIDAGFMLRQVVEFSPTREQIEEMPPLIEELERPMMLLISASR